MRASEKFILFMPLVDSFFVHMQCSLRVVKRSVAREWTNASDFKPYRDV